VRPARARFAVAGLLALGCVSIPRWYDENPRLAVQVWGGFAEAPMSSAEEQRVEVLVDASSAMQSPMSAGPSRAEVARTAATRFVLELPPTATVRVSEIGSGRRCGPPHPLGRSASGEDRLPLAASLASLEAGEDGSIAQGLSELAESLRLEQHPTRVVAFSDLTDPCGGDLCAATAALASVGASLDLVVIGDAPIPECVAATRRSQGTDDLPATVGEEGVPFRVLVGGVVALEGRAGDPPVEAPAEPVTVVIDLDPPLSLGPMRLAPDSVTSLQVLEFPHATPPVREWRWDVLLATGEGETP